MNPNLPKTLRPKDVIRLYPVLGSEGHLANLRCQRRGPRYYKDGPNVIYKSEDVEAYLFRCPVLTIDSLEPARGAR
jgi:hypothetical protein